MPHIMLTPKVLKNDPTDPLRRTFYGWDPLDSLDVNWANNHGYYRIGSRADAEEFVLFSFRPLGRIVMAGRIDAIRTTVPRTSTVPASKSSASHVTADASPIRRR